MNISELLEHIDDETDLTSTFTTLRMDLDCLQSSETLEDITLNLNNITDSLELFLTSVQKAQSELKKHRSA